MLFRGRRCDGVLRVGFLSELPIDSVQQFLNFAILVTLRIIGAGFHGASLPDETSQRKDSNFFPSEIC